MEKRWANNSKWAKDVFPVRVRLADSSWIKMEDMTRLIVWIWDKSKYISMPCASCASSLRGNLELLESTCIVHTHQLCFSPCPALMPQVSTSYPAENPNVDNILCPTWEWENRLSLEVLNDVRWTNWHTDLAVPSNERRIITIVQHSVPFFLYIARLNHGSFLQPRLQRFQIRSHCDKYG